MIQQIWKCLNCFNKKYSKKEDTTIKICYACQIDMVQVNEVENGKD